MPNLTGKERHLFKGLLAKMALHALRRKQPAVFRPQLDRRRQPLGMASIADQAFRIAQVSYWTEVGQVNCHLHKTDVHRRKPVAYYDAAYTNRMGQRVSIRYLYGYNPVKGVFPIKELSRKYS